VDDTLPKQLKKKIKFATDTETGRFVAIKILDKAKIRANNMGEQIKKEVAQRAHTHSSSRGRGGPSREATAASVPPFDLFGGTPFCGLVCACLRL